MPECPICFLKLKLDEAEFAAHVKYHFEHEGDERPYFEHGFDETGIDGGSQGGDILAEGSGGMGLVRSVGGYADIGNENDRRTLNNVDVNPSSAPACFICGTDLSHLLSETARQAHANACLDRAGFSEDGNEDGGQRWDGSNSFVMEGFAGQDRQQDKGEGPSTSTNTKHNPSSILRSKGDPWWCPSISPFSSLPPNYSPSLIPILHQILLLSHSQSPPVTRSAVLANPSTCHVKATWGFDIGWGCGYRNFLMGLTTVLSARGEYRVAFGLGESEDGTRKLTSTMDPDAPGVRNLQLWMAQGWNEGFDPTGREQFKNQIVGTKKWIGTSDMYVVFTRKGIPCQLYDFPKATGGKWHSASNTHAALVRWVTVYFDGDAEPQSSPKKLGAKAETQATSAFDVMMHNGNKPAGSRNINISAKMPLILQHAGHSRTIVGYEINAQGSTNLLMFDPNGGISAEIRQSGIDHLRKEQHLEMEAGPSSSKGVTHPVTKRGRTNSPSDRQAALFADPADWSDGEAADSTPAPHNQTGQKRRSESPQGEMATKKRKSEGSGPASGMKKWLGSGTPGRGKQCEWERKPVKALGTFRVNLGSLSRNSAYQILAFTGGPLLTDSEKRSKRIVTSIQILE